MLNDLFCKGAPTCRPPQCFEVGKCITIYCNIKPQDRYSDVASPQCRPGELLMAAGQPLLSLFSCTIRRISEKHNRGGDSQGKEKALACRGHRREEEQAVEGPVDPSR